MQSVIIKNSDRKSKILQLEFLATCLPRIGIQSDLIWFDIVSLSNLFSQDDFLHHLLESVLKNNQQFSQIDILLIIRLLCLEHFINALSQYTIEQFDLNTVQINDYDFQGINIITLPNILLLNKEYQENF
ncbi:unnamed protein product [Adineta steineri]|uniref:Uncharacterized protein n=1 Tax=Adineta steineri TaxID=433720 RepID=A0A818VW32_9BILA|nr:unnamed protein product [Adineta steineri]CAF3716440.1 unnamed protein product [Adineta steineri]